MFKNGHLRLLMTLVGFRRAGDEDDPEGSWTIPSTLSADQLKEALDLIKKFEFSPPVFDDGQEAGDFIKRKSASTAARKRAVFDDEDDGIDDDEEELLFEPGGPTDSKKSAAALEALKKSRRRRRKEGTEDAEDRRLTDEQLNARAEARRQKELEKNRKIKSEMYVQDSDDDAEADEAFFAKEQEIRQRTDLLFREEQEKIRQQSNITKMKELLHVGKGKERKGKGKKRQSSAITADSDDDDELLTGISKSRTSATPEDSDGAGRASARSSSAARDNVLEESEDEATDTPMSSPHVRPSQSKRRKVSSDVSSASPEPAVEEPVKEYSAMVVDDDEDEDDDIAPVARPARQRVRSGFIVDSSDEE